MNNKESLKHLIKTINTGKRFPALQLVKQDPEMAATISKLVKPRDKTDFDVTKPATFYSLNQSQIQSISDKTKARIKDNDNIMQLFPDMELAAQILISSILSPKDMVKTEIIYKTNEPILPSELTMKLNSEFKKHIEGHYGLLDDIQDILRDIIIESGSHIKAVLPESIVDEIINDNISVSTEALRIDMFRDNDQVHHLGILGNSGSSDTTKVSLESLVSGKRITHYDPRIKAFESETKRKDPHLEKLHTSLEVVDNYKLLKLPSVISKANEHRLKSIIRKPQHVATEAYGADQKLTHSQLTDVLYKDGKGGSKTFMVLPSKFNTKRKSIGRPLVLNLPSESVIPIYIPGSPSKHVGYFVLTDGDGNPVTIDSNQENMEGLASLLRNPNQNQSLSSVLISKARRNLTDNSSEITIDGITRVYASIVERDLVERLKNGLYGNDNISIGTNEEIYRIMLARSLASKYTRMIFVPGELVTYFAFKYFTNGVGKSFLDDVKILSSLRAILLFSKVMAQTKSAINLTTVNMTLDENDPDPQRTVELAVHEIIKMRQQYFPLGINTPVDIADWIQRAGFEFTFEGHPGLPQTKFEFDTKNLQHTVPDNELDDALRKQGYMALGLTPEIVDNAYSPDFATTIIANNILLSKRILQWQLILTKHLSDYARKLAYNDSFIIKDLKEVLKANKALVEKSLTDEEKAIYNENSELYLSDVVDRYIENIVLDLPKPDVTSLDTQLEAFNKYKDSLSATIDAWISTEFLSNDLIGGLNENIESIKSVVMNHFIRKWMSDNGFMNELNDIVTADEDGKPNLDIYEVSKNHTEGVVRAALNYIKSLQGLKMASDKDIENMNVEPTETTGSSYDSGGSEDTGGGDDFGMDMGDMGDFGMDMGGEETTEEPPTPEEEETPPTE